MQEKDIIITRGRSEICHSSERQLPLRKQNNQSSPMLERKTETPHWKNFKMDPKLNWCVFIILLAICDLYIVISLYHNIIEPNYDTYVLLLLFLSF